MGRINQADQERLEEEGVDANYRGTDFIGKAGIEASYQHELHGTTGFEHVEIDAAGRGIRALSRTASLPGNNVALTLDLRLQQVAEQALGRSARRASWRSTPRTARVLAFVSKPGFDPNYFVDGIDPQYWAELNNSPDRPLYNRAIAGTYPPGSTFKPFMALAALELGKRTPRSAINDPRATSFSATGASAIRSSAGTASVDLYKSIVVSSDTYYYMLANDMGIDAIAGFMKHFGFGAPTGIDIAGRSARACCLRPNGRGSASAGPSSSAGTRARPSRSASARATTRTRRSSSRTPRRRSPTTASCTARTSSPTSTIRAPASGAISSPRSCTACRLQPEHIEFVKRAMVGVNKEGTGARSVRGRRSTRAAARPARRRSIAMKQNEKYDEKKVAERHRDHSLFIAFAPAESPKIALAVIVENGGFGARAAAPIARTVFDYYLLGKVPDGLTLQTPEDEVDDDERESD